VSDSKRSPRTISLAALVAGGLISVPMLPAAATEGVMLEPVLDETLQGATQLPVGETTDTVATDVATTTDPETKSASVVDSSPAPSLDSTTTVEPPAEVLPPAPTNEVNSPVQQVVEVPIVDELQNASVPALNEQPPVSNSPEVPKEEVQVEGPPPAGFTPEFEYFENASGYTFIAITNVDTGVDGTYVTVKSYHHGTGLTTDHVANENGLIAVQYPVEASEASLVTLMFYLTDAQGNQTLLEGMTRDYVIPVGEGGEREEYDWFDPANYSVVLNAEPAGDQLLITADISGSVFGEHETVSIDIWTPSGENYYLWHFDPEDAVDGILTVYVTVTEEGPLLPGSEVRFFHNYKGQSTNIWFKQLVLPDGFNPDSDDNGGNTGGDGGTNPDPTNPGTGDGDDKDEDDDSDDNGGNTGGDGGTNPDPTNPGTGDGDDKDEDDDSDDNGGNTGGDGGTNPDPTNPGTGDGDDKDEDDDSDDNGGNTGGDKTDGTTPHKAPVPFDKHHAGNPSVVVDNSVWSFVDAKADSEAKAAAKAEHTPLFLAPNSPSPAEVPGHLFAGDNLKLEAGTNDGLNVDTAAKDGAMNAAVALGVITLMGAGAAVATGLSRREKFNK